MSNTVNRLGDWVHRSGDNCHRGDITSTKVFTSNGKTTAINHRLAGDITSPNAVMMENI